MADIVFKHYLTEHSGQLSDRVRTIQHYSESAGVRDIAGEVLHRLEQNDSFNEVDQDSLATASRKLMRLAADYQQDRFENMLLEQAAWWRSKLEFVDPKTFLSTTGLREDYILYEIGYVEYLLGEFDAAESTMSASLDASFKLMQKYLQNSISVNDEEWAHGAMALANIWVSAGVRNFVRFELAARTEEPGSDAHTVKIQAIIRNEVDRYKALQKANSAAPEESEPLYLDALRMINERAVEMLTSCRIARPAALADYEPGAATVRRMYTFLGERESVSWISAIRLALWPMLYGWRPVELPDIDPVPNTEDLFIPRFSSSGIGVTRSSKLYLTSLWRMAQGSIQESGKLALDALGTYIAERQIEERSWLFLLAYRLTARDDVAEAIAEYAEAHLNETGTNLLPLQTIRRCRRGEISRVVLLQ